MSTLIDKIAVARLLGVSLRSVDNYRHNGNMPCHVLPGSRVVRFDKTEILRWAGLDVANENSDPELETMTRTHNAVFPVKGKKPRKKNSSRSGR